MCDMSWLESHNSCGSTFTNCFIKHFESQLNYQSWLYLIEKLLLNILSSIESSFSRYTLSQYLSFNFFSITIFLSSSICNISPKTYRWFPWWRKTIQLVDKLLGVVELWRFQSYKRKSGRLKASNEEAKGS